MESESVASHEKKSSDRGGEKGIKNPHDEKDVACINTT